MVLHGQAVEEDGLAGVPAFVPGDHLLDQGGVGEIGPVFGAFGHKVLPESHGVKADPGQDVGAVVQLVRVGVEGHRAVPCVFQQAGGGGQVLVNREAQGVQRVALPQQGGGQAGEHLHLHVAGAAAVGVGDKQPVGAGLRQPVEVGQGVLRERQAGQAGDVEKALGGQEDDVRGVLSGGGAGLVGLFPELGHQVRDVRVPGAVLRLDAVGQGGVEAQHDAQLLAAVLLVLAGLIQGHGGLLQGAGIGGGEQQGQRQRNGKKPHCAGGMPLFQHGQQHRPENTDDHRHHHGQRGGQHIRGKPGDVAQVAHERKITELEGSAVDIHLIPADDGQGHAEPGPRQIGDEEPPGQAVEREHQAKKQEPK